MRMLLALALGRRNPAGPPTSLAPPCISLRRPPSGTMEDEEVLLDHATPAMDPDVLYRRLMRLASSKTASEGHEEEAPVSWVSPAGGHEVKFVIEIAQAGQQHKPTPRLVPSSASVIQKVGGQGCANKVVNTSST